VSRSLRHFQAAGRTCRSPLHCDGSVGADGGRPISLIKAFRNTSGWCNGQISKADIEAVYNGLRIGAPLRVAYGSTEIEKLDVYRADRAKAPIFIFIHCGNWFLGSANNEGYPAEMFVRAGANYIALDFASAKDVGGDLRVMAAQVRRAIAWVYQNAAVFDGDPERLYVGGRSSGGHLCGVALVTDWEKDFGLPKTTVKGGLCISGIYEMTPVRLSWRRTYVNFTDAMAEGLIVRAQRFVDFPHVFGGHDARMSRISAL
jgi:hypothetical protein